MAFVPLMPSGADELQSPMGTTGAPAPVPPGGGGDLASLLGVGGAPTPNGSGMGGMMGGMDPVQMGLGQFDQLAQMVADMARMFPGSEQLASQMMEILDQWRQQVLVMSTPQPSAMPGASNMM